MKAAIIGPKITDDWNQTYEEIRKILKSNQIEVDFSYFERSVDEDASDLERTYRSNQELIKKNDFIIAETTEYSGGIGYLIADSLNNKTPVLALFNSEKGKTPSNVIKSSTVSKRLEFKKYKSNNLDQIIKEYLLVVKPMLDTKFLVNLPVKLDRFLEFYAYKRGIPKSYIVREAIVDLMEKNKNLTWDKENDF